MRQQTICLRSRTRTAISYESIVKPYTVTLQTPFLPTSQLRRQIHTADTDKNRQIMIKLALICCYIQKTHALQTPQQTRTDGPFELTNSVVSERRLLVTACRRELGPSAWLTSVQVHGLYCCDLTNSSPFRSLNPASKLICSDSFLQVGCLQSSASPPSPPRPTT